MPIYEYECDVCGHNFEIKQGYHDKPKKKCPECKKMALHRVFSVLYTSVRGSPNTVLQQAERNTEKMGKYELEEKRLQHKREKDQAKLQSLKNMGVVSQEATDVPQNKTWYNPEGKDLNKELRGVDTVEKAKKYIAEGKK